MRGCRAAVFAVALSAVAGVVTGCARDAERAPSAGPAPASAGTVPPAPQDVRPISLPDLSRTAASVQEQIRAAHASMMRQIDNPGTRPPELASAYGDMGKLLMAAEFGPAAESCLLNAQTLAPDDMRWPYYLGHLYKEQGAYEKSTAAFERALRLRPDDLATLIWIGEAYLALDRPDAAEPAFAKARSLQPRSAAALAGLGRVLLAKRDYAAAARHLEEALALDAQATVIHYSLAMAYRGAGDLPRAEAHLRQRGTNEVPVPDPLMQEVRGLLRSASAFESLGIAALERGDAAAAAMYFRKGLEVSPDAASLHHRLGTALLLAGETRAGQQEFEAALRIAPDFARAHYSLGVLMITTGQYQSAVERLSAAVASDPDYLEARLLLADVLRQGGRSEESLRHYERVISRDPRAAEARLGQALALVSMGQYQQARVRLTEATAAHLNHPDLTQALVRLLAAAPDPKVREGRLAVALMQKVVEAQSTPERDETMAMAYAESGDFPQAVAWQRRAMTAAERAGRHPHLREQMAENLRLFERGEACRIPWREGTMP